MYSPTVKYTVFALFITVVSNACSTSNQTILDEGNIAKDTDTSDGSSSENDLDSETDTQNPDDSESSESSGDGSTTSDGKDSDDAQDADSDGWFAELDCDDSNASVNPAAEEQEGNGIDDDCDGAIDEAPSDDPNTERGSSLLLEQVWYLTNQTTNNILIDFRSGSPVVQCNGPVGSSDGFEGTGVFTRPDDGELLFYTDGRNVFNGQTNATLENGTGLNGDASATEPALLSPKPGSKSHFYIFTNNTNVNMPSGVYYSEIDLELGTNGTVLTKNEELFTGNPGEALDLLPHPNGKHFWLLIFDSAERIRSYLVTESGVSDTPVISDTGLTGQVKRGCINHTYDYDTLVLGQNYGGSNGTISVAAVDRETGKVEPADVIATGDLGYHASFSEDGTKIYYVRGTEGWSGSAYQYDLNTAKETSLGGSGLGGSKLAPDGKLYWVGYSDTSIAIVHEPNELGAACNFEMNALPLGGCSAGFSVPNQTASYLEYIPPLV